MTQRSLEARPPWPEVRPGRYQTRNGQIADVNCVDGVYSRGFLGARPTYWCIDGQWLDEQPHPYDLVAPLPPTP